MGQVSTTFPDSIYTSSNKPVVETLKTDIAALETAHNATDTLSVETTDTDVSSNSWVLDEDAMGSDSNQKVPTQQSVKAYVDAAITATKTALYPVGSIYINYSVATNPGTLLGFGTWVALEGEVLVGKTSSGTFSSIGSVGAETADISHVHTGPSHTHTYSGTTDSSNQEVSGEAGGSNRTDINHDHDYSGTTVAGGTGNTGSSGSATQSLVQESRVVYMWRRTV